MKSPQVPNDPLSQFSLSVFMVNGLLMHLGESVTRPLGQSSAKWQVLGRAGFLPQTVSQMAREMGNSRQNVQYTADALEREGLVVYKNNPADRRARLVALTPRGAEVLSAIYARNEEWSRHVMAKLNSEQLVQVANALEGIARIFEKHIKKESNHAND